MTAGLEKEDWDDLIQMIRDAANGISSEGAKGAKQALASFHSTASMLGLVELEHAGIELEKYVVSEIAPGGNAEAAAAFGFAISAFLEELEGAQSGKNGGIAQVREVFEILGIDYTPTTSGELSDDEIPSDDEPPAPANVSEPEPVAQADEAAPVEPVSATIPEPPQAAPVEPEVKADSAKLSDSECRTALEQIVVQLGGTFACGDGVFTLQFKDGRETVTQIETLLSAGDPQAHFAPHLPRAGYRADTVLRTIKDFMVALSNSQVGRAQEILQNLAEQQQQAGLYNEVGSMARELHNSLRGFMDTMDPSLRELVVEKLPDSGNRLEHILQLTETSANTTIDHVEQMQKLNDKDQHRIEALKQSLGKLKAIGEQAEKRLGESGSILDELMVSALKNHDNLITILTAQDYQDLTGQIIQKIIQLLKDLERKLLGVIQTFGVKVEKGDQTAKKAAPEEPEELYGPAHMGKEEALHSQDDVDALLAEFGF